MIEDCNSFSKLLESKNYMLSVRLNSVLLVFYFCAEHFLEDTKCVKAYATVQIFTLSYYKEMGVIKLSKSKVQWKDFWCKKEDKMFGQDPKNLYVETLWAMGNVWVIIKTCR